MAEVITHKCAGPLAGTNTPVTLHRRRVQAISGLAEHGSTARREGSDMVE